MASNIPLHRIGAGLLVSMLFCLSAACTQEAGSAPVAPLRVTSDSFKDGGSMPSKLTCDGADVSPDLQLPSPPAGTKSLAIIMEDPDAPEPFTHWVAYDIPAGTHHLAEGASTPHKRFEGAAEGLNSFGDLGYEGPCPPSGSPHHYIFHVYALDEDPRLPAGQTRDQLAAAVRGHVLAEGMITGIYGR
ncbi:MAG TPA: YbhB/YbcL family Raf kinase inhibitor-like protein [Dyella sp.]|uniref:YbhB/YbcL family Raf kinase inhibitor-like protein n=1 Tax=Dyella sp. TaxID=1869338 RepID=UPI002D18B80A|nr:YbhB/YbcL family Raf kinase inhibitor-like protein [Dyella sp.]HTV84283.1 YbhB/YbcL family Raf kinase inhibitor-like protein [Dyella sp.]